MPKIGRPRAEVVVTDDERAALVRLTKRARVNRAMAFRARIVLACIDSSDTAVARRLRTTKTTVAKWRSQFVERRLEGLYDEPRVGAPRTISDEQVEAIIVKTLETTPPGETHWSTRSMAKAAGVSHTMVGRIWRTFRLQPHRTESFKISPDPQLVAKIRDVVGLYDEPRVGAPRIVSDEAVEAVIVKTLETTPKGETHWSTRTMAKAAGLSHTMVGRIWRTFGLQPHVTESFKLSSDPQLVAKIRDVVGLYMHPPHNAVVFAVDEKSQIQALQRAQPILPMDLGHPERRTHNYLRHGTVDLFAVLNVATGEVIARCKPQHRAQDFVAFLRDIDAAVDAEREVHVVLDNLSAHKAPPVHRWLLRHPRFQFHFTPTYASWLNLVERFFGLLTAKALKRGSHTSIPQLRDAILAYVDAHNENGKPFKWTKTADEILEKMRRFGIRTQLAHT